MAVFPLNSCRLDGEEARATPFLRFAPSFGLLAVDVWRTVTGRMPFLNQSSQYGSPGSCALFTHRWKMLKSD